MTESEKLLQIKKPVDKKIIKKPVDKKVIKKPVDKKIIKKPVDKKIIKKSVDKKVIKKPVDKKVIKKPVDKKVIKKPVDKKVIKKPVDKKVIKKPVDKKSFKDGGGIYPSDMRKMNPYDLTESHIGRLIKIPERHKEGILLSFEKEKPITTRNLWKSYITKYYTTLYFKNDTTTPIKLQSYIQEDTMFIEKSPTDNILKKTILSDSSQVIKTPVDNNIIKKPVDNNVIKNSVDKKSFEDINPRDTHDMRVMNPYDLTESHIGRLIKIPERHKEGILLRFKKEEHITTSNLWKTNITKYYTTLYFKNDTTTPIKLQSYIQEDTMFIEK